MELGKAHFDRGDLFEAIRAVRTATELAPGDLGAQMNLAVLYERMGLVAPAHEAYGHVAALSPRDARASAKLSELDPVVADEARRRQWLNRTIDQMTNETGETPETGPDDHPETCRRAAATWNDFEFDGALDEENLRRAAALYEQSIAEKSDDLHAYRDAATIYEILEDYPAAAGLWQHLSARSPDDQLAANNAQRLALLQRLSEGSTRSGAQAGTLSEIGALHAMSGDPERAVEFFERSLVADPAQPRIWLLLAESLFHAGRYEKALEASMRALELDPGLERAAQFVEQFQALR